MNISPSIHFNVKHLGGQAPSQVCRTTGVLPSSTCRWSWHSFWSFRYTNFRTKATPARHGHRKLLGCCDRSHIEFPKRPKKKSSAQKIPKFSQRNTTSGGSAHS